MRIDLNADLGEGCGHDEAILDQVSSINIACGFHAGGADEMLKLVRAAIARGVAIGAHPSYPDRENFGRAEMNLALESIRAGILYQVGALDAIVRSEGGALAHVKAHGALYNQSARDPEIGRCIAQTVRDFNPKLKVMGLAGSLFIQTLRAAGLCALEEGFADRRYNEDGSLVKRGTPGALIEDEAVMLAQVASLTGTTRRVHVDTICVHGDGPHALRFVTLIRERLLRDGIQVAPC